MTVFENAGAQMGAAFNLKQYHDLVLSVTPGHLILVDAQRTRVGLVQEARCFARLATLRQHRRGQEYVQVAEHATDGRAIVVRESIFATQRMMQPGRGLRDHAIGNDGAEEFDDDLSRGEGLGCRSAGSHFRTTPGCGDRRH